MGLKKLLKERSNKSVQDEDGKHKKSERPEESLQEIEGRYRKLLSHTQAIQYTHDLQGQFLSVDQETTELLGYDRNSLLNMNVSALLASEVRHQFETYLDEIKRQGLAKGLMVVQTASGEKRILKYYNTLQTEGVPVPFVQGIAYDVTEQNQTKKTLKQLSEQLSIILKSLPIVCYIGKAEEDYGATYITHNVKAITGFEQTDFTSKPFFWANRVHPEDAPKIFADLPQIFEKGYHEHQYRWQVADGSYKWFYDYTRLMKSSDGKNYIIGMMQDITERKRAEEALLNAAQQWRTTFDGINDFVSLLDLEGKILRCNKAMKDFVGKPFNEIINHSCWEIILGVTTPIEDCPFLRMKETLHRETTILSVNNLWFNVSIDPIFDQAGRLIGAVNIISDITKRKQAEEALRLFERAIETLQLGLTITDSHGKIIYINLAEAKMHGYQVEELIGKDVRTLAPREIWNPMTVEQLLKMDSWKRETINIRKDGSTFPVHLLSVVVPNVPGDALGVITTCEDISERKSAEVALRRSEEKYRTILENIEDGYYEVDIAGNFTFFNDSICRIWGYPKEELMGMNDRQYTDQENAKKLFQAFNKVYRTGEPTKEVGWKIIRKDGTKRYIEASVSLLKDSSGKPIGFRGIIRDVTEHVQAEEAVTRLSHENAVMAEIGRVISSTLNIDEVYEHFAEEVRKLIFIDRVSLCTINPDGRSATITYSWGSDIKNRKKGDVFPLKGTLVEMASTRRSGILVEAGDEETFVQTYPTLLNSFRAGFRSFMSVPLISKDQVIGALILHTFKEKVYTEQDLQLAERVGNQIAGAIANVQLYTERKRAEEAAERLARENAVVAEIGRIISSTINIDEVYERFSEEVRKLISFDRIMINIVNLENNTTSFGYTTGIDVPGRRVGDIVPLEGTATGECVRTRSGFLFQTKSMDEVVKRFPGLLPTFQAGLRSMIFVPLMSKDQVIGVLSLRTVKPSAYTEADLRLAERVGDQIAGAIANSQLYTERKRAEEAAGRLAQENAVMAEIGRIISSTLNIDEVYERFAEEVRKLLPFDRIVINVIDIEKATVINVYMAGTGIADRKVEEVYPLKGSGNAEMVRTKSSLLIQTEDFNEYKDRFPMLLSTFQAGFRSIMNIPLFSKGRIIGGLLLRSLKPYAYTDGDVRLAERVGDQIAGAIANSQLYTERKLAEEAAGRLAQENAVVAEIGRIVSSTLDIDEVYERFAEEVYKVIPSDRISVNIINPDRTSITMAYAFGIKVRDLPKGAVLPLDDPFSENILNNRQGVLILPEDESELAKSYPNLVKHFRIGIRSMMAVPLISKDQVIGLLHFQSLKLNSYTESDLTLAERVGNQIAGAIANSQLYTERKRAEEAAERLARENAVVAEIGRIVSSSLDISEVYERFAEEVHKLISFDRIMINIVNLESSTTSFGYITGIDVQGRRVGDIVPLEGTGTGECISTRSSFLFQTENTDEVVKRFPGLLPTFQAGLRSMIFVPLMSKDQAIGVLSLRMIKPNAYSKDDLRLAERVGDQIAGAIANAQLYTERKRAEEAAGRLAQENAVMAEIGRIVSSTLDIDEVYERFAEEVGKLISFDRLSIQTVNTKASMTTLDYISGVDIEGRRSGDIIPLEGTAIGECLRTRSSFLFQTESIDEVTKRFPGFLPTFKAGLRSMISVPLFSKDEVIGFLNVRSLKSNAYTESDLKLVERVGNQIASAIANAQLYAEQKQMEEALRKSEEGFRDLYDHAPLGYHEYDAKGMITNVNRTDLDMLGYTAEEMIGQPMWKFNVGEDTVRQQVLAKLASTLPPGRNLERIYRRKDGTTIPVLVEDRLILDEKGQIKGIRCTIQDITERKRAEEERLALQEQLRQSQKMEAIGKLAGGVAHDFNNLLTVIHGYSELILSSLDQSSRLRQDVQEIINASERASSLTRQLLAFSRKQVLQPKVLDLNAHVSNMDKMLRRMIGEDVELVTLLTKDLGRIKADPGQIEQVILNLAVNAKDAMLSGGKLTIETANVILDENYARSRIGVTPGDYVMLSMSDTGVGMAPETKERIFEPFFTTKEKERGTGLGLSTVYGIVQQSGGNIWVYSEPGFGTTFKIYLPRIEERTELMRPAAVSTKSLQGSETILLVEDEEMVRKLACTVLQGNGYKVLEASNGDEALDVVQGRNGNPIHLVVTDVVMPGMSGRQLADRLVSLRPEIKILYMSGYTDNAIVHHGVLDPGIAYIQKPFTPDALASKVRDILDGN